MSKSHVIKQNRVIWTVLIFAAAMLLVLGRLAFLMVFYADTNLAKASDQWTRTTSVTPSRGQIVDCEGNLLAGSSDCDRIVLFPKSLYQDDEQYHYGAVEYVIKTLAEVLEMDEADVRKKLEANKERSEYTFKRQITQEQSDDLAARIEASNAAKEGDELYRKLRYVSLVADTRRYYPNGAFMTQILGFTSVDGDGLEGIEAKYDSYLAGTPGSVTYAKDGSGNELSEGSEVAEYTAPIDGYTVQLTLNGVLQSFAENEAEACLTEQNAEAVRCLIMDPEDSRLLSVVNLPDFDNNDPPRDDTATLNKLSKNGCISETYEVGSFLNLLVAAQELDSGSWSLSEAFSCEGTLKAGTKTYSCQGVYSHGEMNLTEALLSGCSTSFSRKARELGVDRIYDDLYAYDLGSTTDVGLYGESSGSLNSSKYMGDEEVAALGLGQGVTMTPIQLLNSICTLVNGGTRMQPYAVKSITDGSGTAVKSYSSTVLEENVVSEDTSLVIRQILEKAAENGCACSGSLLNYSIGAYCTTVPLRDEDGKADGGYTVIYAAVAPIDDPEIALLFLVDRPGGDSIGNSAAIPYAEKIMEECLQYLGESGGSETENKTSVPSVTGQSASLAARTLKELGFSVTVQGGEGNVKVQYPAAGSVVPIGSCITLECGLSLPEDDWVEVPDLACLKATEARKALQELELEMAIEGNGSEVLSQSPAPFTRVRKGTIVTVKFSQVLDPPPEEETEE